jgi:hypothetical protein
MFHNGTLTFFLILLKLGWNMWDIYINFGKGLFTEGDMKNIIKNSIVITTNHIFGIDLAKIICTR